MAAMMSTRRRDAQCRRGGWKWISLRAIDGFFRTLYEF
jgi:hypothetical protein